MFRKERGSFTEFSHGPDTLKKEYTFAEIGPEHHFSITVSGLGETHSPISCHIYTGSLMRCYTCEGHI